MDVYCNECKSFLFETEDGKNPGAIGAEAQDKGFVYKNASLFSDVYSSLYFCNHGCGKAFYKENIPRNPELSKSIEDLKREIPGISKSIANRMAKLTANLRRK